MTDWNEPTPHMANCDQGDQPGTLCHRVHGTPECVTAAQMQAEERRAELANRAERLDEVLVTVLYEVHRADYTLLDVLDRKIAAYNAVFLTCDAQPVVLSETQVELTFTTSQDVMDAQRHVRAEELSTLDDDTVEMAVTSVVLNQSEEILHRLFPELLVVEDEHVRRRAIDDPVQLAKGARIVRQALARKEG